MRATILALCDALDAARDTSLILDALTIGQIRANRVLRSGIEAENDVRNWWHYPIQMPVNESGEGPATVGKDAVLVKYEVWDRLYNTHAIFDNLPDAINKAMELNAALAQKGGE